MAGVRARSGATLGRMHECCSFDVLRDDLGKGHSPLNFRAPARRLRANLGGDVAKVLTFEQQHVRRDAVAICRTLQLRSVASRRVNPNEQHDRCRHDVREKRQLPHGRVLRIEDWRYEDPDTVVNVWIYLGEDTRKLGYRWISAVFAYRRRVLKKTAPAGSESATSYSYALAVEKTQVVI